MKMSRKELKKLVKEEVQKLHETDLESIKLPSNVQKFTDRLVGQIKRVNLTKPRKYALVGRIVAALGIDANKLSTMMNIIKKDMRNK
tara:strand:- start:45 stop:305 length:261 start_codon:yes stop_codon:yes gene_type:complete